MKRAYSLLEVKAFDEDSREFSGIATTPTPDRMGDIVDPLGAKFSLPIPLLWQHDASKPIGEVFEARPTKSGIQIKGRVFKATQSRTLMDRLDEAWESMKLRLVRGLSIGFSPKKEEPIKDGFKFLEWDWLELSAVTIPANSEASILAVKSIDRQQRAASGQRKGVVFLDNKNRRVSQRTGVVYLDAATKSSEEMK
jgi:HK97 family phage prohead protease